MDVKTASDEFVERTTIYPTRIWAALDEVLAVKPTVMLEGDQENVGVEVPALPKPMPFTSEDRVLMPEAAPARPVTDL